MQLPFTNLDATAAATSTPPLPLSIASAPPFVRDVLNNEPLFVTSTTQLYATIKFAGESSTTMDIPMPNNVTSSISSAAAASIPSKYLLTDWLSSTEATEFFLGTSNYKKRSDDDDDDYTHDNKTHDGLWDTVQPPVDWFGLTLSPVFVIQLSHSEGRLVTNIREARSDVLSGKDSPTGRLVSRLMNKSTFQGGNTVTWKTKNSDHHHHHNNSGWTLTLSVSLTLIIDLPPFLPVPPGFNSIGSRIIKSTCRKRLDQLAIDMRDAYLEWANEQLRKENQLPQQTQQQQLQQPPQQREEQ